MSLNTILATAPLTTTNYILKATGTALGNSIIYDNGTNVGIGNTNTSYTLDVSGTGRFTGALIAGATTLNGNLDIASGYFINMDWTNDTRTVWERYNSATYFQRISSNAPSRQLRIESNGAYGNASIVLDGQSNTTVTATITSDKFVATGAATFSSTISAGVITGDSNSTGVPSIIAKVGSGGNNGTYGFGNSSAYIIRGGSDYGAMIFDTGSVERMRILNDNTVCFGKTVYDNSTTGVSIADTKTTAIVSVVTDAGVSILCNRKTTTGQMFVFRYNGSNVGDISTNGSTITFSGNAVSDNRYKDNIEKITNAVDAINKVDWVTFKYKDNQRDSAGVTAQQLQTVPELLKFVIDGIDEDSYKAVDYNAIIGYLGAAIKEQNQIITSLQEQINELKNK